MFIAVINENFDVAEEQKRSQQASHFWATQRPQQARAAWIRRLNPYRWFAAKPKAIAVDQLPSNLVLPMQKSLVQDYTFASKEPPKLTKVNRENQTKKNGRTQHLFCIYRIAMEEWVLDMRQLGHSMYFRLCSLERMQQRTCL